MARVRADQFLVQRGQFESRARAQAAIAAGLVTADGAVVRKASDMVDEGAAIVAQAPHPYVSRGGLKLAAALDAFGIAVEGLRGLDIGASTGGFTDVLLRRGARHVVAIDVGRDQLHPSLRDDARVTSLEGTDIRGLSPQDIGGACGIAAIDVSFISLKLVLPAATALLLPGAALVALVKPQFEVGRGGLKKGIVRDEAMQEAAVSGILASLPALGLTALGPAIPSPIAGGDGNREFLIAARLAR